MADFTTSVIYPGSHQDVYATEAYPAGVTAATVIPTSTTTYVSGGNIINGGAHLVRNTSGGSIYGQDLATEYISGGNGVAYTHGASGVNGYSSVVGGATYDAGYGGYGYGGVNTVSYPGAAEARTVYVSEPAVTEVRRVVNDGYADQVGYQQVGFQQVGYPTVQETDVRVIREEVPTMLDYSQYQINYDPDPEIVRKENQDVVSYRQEVAVRYLRPPTPPPPGPVVIREERAAAPPPAPPVVIRQRPPRPPTPPPIILRERPPVPPASIAPKMIVKTLPPPPPPPRRVIVERLPAAPPKPRAVIIERWLPYKQLKRRVVYQRAGPAPVPIKPRNLIIQWEQPQVRVVREFRHLGIIRMQPELYIQRYGTDLHRSSSLPDIGLPTRELLAREGLLEPVEDGRVYNEYPEVGAETVVRSQSNVVTYPGASETIVRSQSAANSAAYEVIGSSSGANLANLASFGGAAYTNGGAGYTTLTNGGAGYTTVVSGGANNATRLSYPELRTAQVVMPETRTATVVVPETRTSTVVIPETRTSTVLLPETRTYQQFDSVPAYQQF